MTDIEFRRGWLESKLGAVGNKESIEGFIESLKYILQIYKSSIAQRSTQKLQHKLLADIAEKGNALIALLDEFCFDDVLNLPQPEKGQAALSIALALSEIRAERQAATGSIECVVIEDQECEISVPINYPSEVVYALKEMLEAVDLAAKRNKLKRGNQPGRNQEYLRKGILAILFTLSYRNSFGKLPSLATGGIADEVFTELVGLAGMDITSESHRKILTRARAVVERY
jgi:hypothetical protein